MLTIFKSQFYSKSSSQNENDNSLVSVLKLEGPLFFGSVVSLMEIYNTAPKHKTLIIDMSFVSMIDLSGIYNLEDLIKVAKSNNVKVLVLSAKSPIKRILEKVNFIDYVGKDNYKDSKESIMSII